MALGDIITAGGLAVNDLFSSQGSAAAANSYTGAAALATQNAQLTAESTRIQEAQTARQVSMTLGTQEADVAGAGFTESGSALDLLSSSAQQGALAKALVNTQGAINENSYAAQAGAYTAEAKSANEASSAGVVSAIASVGGALLNSSSNPIGTLADAGKTVVQGINIFGGTAAPAAGTAFSGAAATSAAETTSSFLSGGSTAAADFSGVAEQSALENTASFLGTDAAPLLSYTDATIAAGADIGLDTSTLAIGSTEAVAGATIDATTAAISDTVAEAVTDVAADVSVDWVPIVGWAAAVAELLNSIPGFANIPIVGPGVGLVAGAAQDLSSGIVGAFSDIGSGNFSQVPVTLDNAAHNANDAIEHGFQTIGDQIDSALGPVAGTIVGLGFQAGATISRITGGLIDDITGGVAGSGTAGEVVGAVTGLFGSVICTALYKRGIISRALWHGAQRYGRDIARRDFYDIYLIWGMPIARAIDRSALFAWFASIVFVPWTHELAAIAGEKTAKPSSFGKMIYGATYVFSLIFLKCLLLREKYANG